MKIQKRDLILYGVLLAITLIGLAIADVTLDNYQMRILNLCGIYIILALSMNLINGFTGLFSLGHAGFMAVGAYVSVLFTLTQQQKEMNFFLQPMYGPLLKLSLPEPYGFPVALIAGTLAAGLLAWVIGAPILRLKDDYLAIATLGFSEIIRVVLTNTQNISNGALGLKGISNYTNVWWSWGLAIATIIFMIFLIKSSYGRALKAIREDEIAAEAMGINVFKHKTMAFVIGCALAGLGGGLLAHLIGTIDPMMFRFVLTFNILLIVVLGGIGSTTGNVVSAIVVTVLMEQMRFLDQSINLGFIETPAIPGLRMVVFSMMLMAVILFYPKGLMGQAEFSWDKLLSGRYFKKTGMKKSA